MNQLQKSIIYLKGVGPNRYNLFKDELGIDSFQDLITYFPNRYIDRSRFYKINELHKTISEVQIIGTLKNIKSNNHKGKTILTGIFSDSTGTVELVWFKGYKWIQPNLKLNHKYVVFGKTTIYKGKYNIAHPEMELLSKYNLKKKVAFKSIYSTTDKISNSGITQNVIRKMLMELVESFNVKFRETLPNELTNNLKLISKDIALRNIHFPENQKLLIAAQRRLKFEEFFYLQIQLLLKYHHRKSKIKGYLFNTVGQYFNNFYNKNLSFDLTKSQINVIKEIRKDIGSGKQMNRLLQGDVGSGKTIVAFMCMLISADNDYQSCLMAPTEILAQQHFKSITNLSKNLGINISILTGSISKSKRKPIIENLKSGATKIIIGTHALLEEKIVFKNLGLAIIDEQHRFGVAQRAKLWRKNILPPHVLVMTATPIPRTLAMSLYGDLDISIMNELPPGRKSIKTVYRSDKNRLKVFKFIKDEINKGRQIYFVYPLIEESEKMDYKDLMDGYESITRSFPLPDYRVSILNGKMSSDAKEYEMKRFINGDTQIMVSTTVIEVGVDVPNASVMVIESSERFGLSQLHQLRGRVGRGNNQGYCILMTGDNISSDARLRIETMVKTNNGFEIADVDLKIRGPGNLMGTKQSGILNFKIADISKDQNLFKLARKYAIEILNKDKSLVKKENQCIKYTLAEMGAFKNIWNYIS